MYTLIFKREPNSTLPIQQISTAISENKRGGETEVLFDRFVLFG